MKKALSLLLTIVIMFSGLFTVAHAYSNVVSVVLNDKELSFDVPAQKINNRTLVPMRKVFESMGALVLWEEDIQTVSVLRGYTLVEITIGNSFMMVNDIAYPLDVPAQVINGRTLIPVRAVSEAIGCTINWDETTQTVFINSPPLTDGYGILYDDYGEMYYSGELKNGVPHGVGSQYVNGILTYSGDHVNGTIYGNGKLYYDDGITLWYEGQVPYGDGVFYNYDGTLLYEGHHIDYKFDGYGIAYIENGHRYEGEFTDGMFDGEGIWYDEYGQPFAQTIYKNDKMINSKPLGYAGEYDALIEWGEEQIAKIYDEAEGVYEDAYHEGYKYFYDLMCGPYQISGSDTHAAATAARQINAMLPDVANNAAKYAESVELEFLANKLDALAKFLEEEDIKLKKKYNIKD